MKVKLALDARGIVLKSFHLGHCRGLGLSGFSPTKIEATRKTMQVESE